MIARQAIACVLSTFAVWLALPGLSHASKLEQAGLSRHIFQQGSFERDYLLYVPKRLRREQRKRPLILVLHGGGGRHRGMVRTSRGRWNQLADKHGLFIVYLNALDRLWDFGTSKTSKKLRRRVDDLGYFKRVIARISKALPIDEKRIFATGISRGGQASYFLACNLPDKIRAIAPIAMPLPVFLVSTCKRSTNPIGVALINGTADPLVPYDGGTIRVFRQKRDDVLSTDDTIDYWRKRNGCPPRPTSIKRLDAVDDDTAVVHSSWTKCTGAPVTLYRVENGGHTWPSGRQYLPRFIVGGTSREINAADEAWRFFKQY